MQCCDMTKRSKKAWMKWRRLVSEQARSGQSVKAFCREQGLCRPYFVVWKKRVVLGISKLTRVSQGALWVELRASELAMILDGIDVSKLKRVRRYERAV